MNLPTFKYHPNPLSTGSIKQSNESCDCCVKETGYIYSASFYCKSRPKICPWCIANGEAHEKFKMEFTILEYDFESQKYTLDDESIRNEVLHRTPAFSSFQQIEWLDHCNDLCEFHGLATVGDFQTITSEEVQRLKVETYLDEAEIEELKKGDRDQEYHYFFKFKCRHCSELKFLIDLD